MYKLARTFLFQMDAEQAHHFVLDNLSRAPQLARLMVAPWKSPASLKQTVLGLDFPHPIGLAAGLDKDGIAIEGLFKCGFSSLEIGTVTPLPQPGNPKPRLFRLKMDEALINRMGFNNQGCQALVDKVSSLSKRSGLIGINIGKNKATPNEQAVDDYDKALKAVAPVADYVTVNISSPNTPGLRDLQSARSITEILRRLKPTLEQHQLPVFVKLSPDLSDEALMHIAETLIEVEQPNRLGVIATNTTLSRTGLKSPARHEPGGLSGRPVVKRSTAVIRTIYQASEGRIPIIGCGGIFDAEDAYQKILAGASLLQIYTAFIYRGPGVVQEIALGLAERLKADGFESIQEAVGKGI